MASQALYRKWRSQTFGDLIGQEAVVQTLKNALQSGRIAHAYLFCGPRGTGKTSAARLLAKTVNCQNPRDGEPCNKCLNCREVTENRSLDVIEIDAASNRGIDEIRDLRAKVGFSPGTGPYKVYVLDEAHMLTPDACNALLKTLEEPPSHVIFVLATTEAHRILPTILSRCQRLDFKRFSVRDTVSRLLYVAQGEGITLEPGAADLMARAAGGGMRDALSLLDQAMAAMGEKITMLGVQQMLGLADPRSVRELVEHIASLRGADGLHLINRLAEAGADLRQLSAQVAEYWRALMLAKAGADVVAVLDRTPEDAAEIAQLAEAFALDELSACARIFSQNDVGARSLSIPQLAVELAFIDCLHLHRQRVSGAGPVQAAPTSTARLPVTNPPGRASSPPTPAPRPQSELAPSIRPALASPVPQSMPASPPAQALTEHAVLEDAAGAAYTSADEVEALDLDAPTALEPAVSVSASVQIEVVTPDGSPVLSASAKRSDVEVEDNEEVSVGAAASVVLHSGLDIQQVTRQWEMIKKACRTKSPKLAALLNHAHPVAVGGEDGCEISMLVEYEFHYKKLLEPTSRNIIEWGLKEILDQPCRARFLQKDDPIPASTLPPVVARPAVPAQPREQRQEPAEPAPRASESVSDDTARPTNGASPAAEQAPSAPAARNGHSAPPPADKQPKNLLEEKIKRDPVVEEIIKTYGAELVDWKPIEE